MAMQHILGNTEDSAWVAVPLNCKGKHKQDTAKRLKKKKKEKAKNLGTAPFTKK